MNILITYKKYSIILVDNWINSILIHMYYYFVYDCYNNAKTNHKKSKKRECY